MALVETHHNALLSRIAGFVSGFFQIFGAATRASNAIENHRRPAKADLLRLGIRPEALPRFV